VAAPRDGRPRGMQPLRMIGGRRVRSRDTPSVPPASVPLHPRSSPRTGTSGTGVVAPDRRSNRRQTRRHSPCCPARSRRGERRGRREPTYNTAQQTPLPGADSTRGVDPDPARKETQSRCRVDSTSSTGCSGTGVLVARSLAQPSLSSYHVRKKKVLHPPGDADDEGHWGVQDSNLRRRSQQIYSLPRLTAPETPRSESDATTTVRPLSSEPPVGFEPTTPRLQVTCSGQLS
jgi:hypothetical protein